MSQITYQEAKYLKHMGDKVNMKVTIEIVDNEPMIYIRDYHFKNFKRAIAYMRRTVEVELVGIESMD